MNHKHLLYASIVALLMLTSLVACTNSGDDLPEPDQNTETGYESNDDYGDDSDEGNKENGEDDYPSQRNDTLTVAEFIAGDFDGSVFVKGYIVGDCTKSFGYAEFESPFSHPQALLLADKKSEREKGSLIAIQLKSGSKIRKHMNLVDNPGWYGKRVVFCGYKEKYLGMAGMKDIMSYPSYNP